MPVLSFYNNKKDQISEKVVKKWNETSSISDKNPGGPFPGQVPS